MWNLVITELSVTLNDPCSTKKSPFSASFKSSKTRSNLRKMLKSPKIDMKAFLTLLLLFATPQILIACLLSIPWSEMNSYLSFDQLSYIATLFLTLNLIYFFPVAILNILSEVETLWLQFTSPILMTVFVTVLTSIIPYLSNSNPVRKSTIYVSIPFVDSRTFALGCFVSILVAPVLSGIQDKKHFDYRRQELVQHLQDRLLRYLHRFLYLGCIGCYYWGSILL